MLGVTFEKTLVVSALGAYDGARLDLLKQCLQHLSSLTSDGKTRVVAFSFVGALGLPESRCTGSADYAAQCERRYGHGGHSRAGFGGTLARAFAARFLLRSFG